MDTGQPPPGGGAKLQYCQPSAMTPASGGDSVGDKKVKMRSFAEIMNDELLHRNIIEIKLNRLEVETESGNKIKAKTLTEIDLSEFLFEVMNLKMEDCEGIGLRSYRYDTKEVKLKRGVDPTPYLTTTPVVFKDHEIIVQKQLNNVTRVSFKNVPFSIPDEEIVHLCTRYGEPIGNKVTYEKNSKVARGLAGSTRYVDMKMNPGVQFENYYWMEGPLSGDLGCRITVLHNGQIQQCSHCLKRANLCPGGGNGRACESLKTERGKMSDYMLYLKEKHGYVSLKMQYLQTQFPPLVGSKGLEDDFGHIEESDVNIDAQEENIEELKQQISDFNLIQQQLLETKAKLAAEQRNSKTAMLKLKHVEKVASQRIVESMPGVNFEDDCNHLTMLLATVLENDDFEYDEDTDQVEPKSQNEFLKKIEESCGDVPDKDVKLSIVKNKVLDKMKRTLRRERLSSRGSMSSLYSRTSSKTRRRSKDSDSENENNAKLVKQQVDKSISRIPALKFGLNKSPSKAN